MVYTRMKQTRSLEKMCHRIHLQICGCLPKQCFWLLDNISIVSCRYRDDYRRDSYRRSPSPYYRRRSPSPYRHRSPSPYGRRRSPSPYYRDSYRERSPYRGKCMPL